SSLHERASRLHGAADVGLGERALGAQRHDGGVRLGAVAILQWCLHTPQLVTVHRRTVGAATSSPPSTPCRAYAPAPWIGRRSPGSWTTRFARRVARSRTATCPSARSWSVSPITTSSRAGTTNARSRTTRPRTP